MWQNNTVHDTKRHVPSQQNLFHRLSQLFLQAVDIHRVEYNRISHPMTAGGASAAVVAAHFYNIISSVSFSI